MNIFNTVRSDIILIIEQLVDKGLLPSGVPYVAVTAEPPKDKSHGDIATNAAMALAKFAGKPPRELAQTITGELEQLPYITNVEVAGPGFINITLSSNVWQNSVKTIIENGIGYGNSDIGKNKKINLEYVSVNPTGPMHIGHARCAVYGDALSLLLLKAGYNVTKEYYINDAGSQIDTLARSAYLRYREASGEKIDTIPEGLYPGDYLVSTGEALYANYGPKLLTMEEKEWLPIVRNFATDNMMSLIRNDLREIGIEHDIFTSEKSLHQDNKIDKAVKILADKGLVYTGVLEPPKGKKPDDWEEREQTLFRSTLFGDDCDRPLRKSDGSWTYFAADIAYALDKIHRNYDSLILILGADHGGYRKRMEAAVEALSNKTVDIDLILCQLVHFVQDGQPLKMSKRAGNYITVRDVIDVVGKDILRFIMLTRKNDMVMDFDLDKVREQSKDNPVFYVQYAHARAQSILRHAAHDMPETTALLHNLPEGLLERLSSPAELKLIRLLASWPRIVETAAIHHEPHRIAFYLQDVAAEFHGLWNKGNEDKALRFIIAEDSQLTSARLALVKSVAIIIASGLFIFNVEPVNEMK
jgi:arginyl-tRNA synthetase